MHRPQVPSLGGAQLSTEHRVFFYLGPIKAACGDLGAWRPRSSGILSPWPPPAAGERLRSQRRRVWTKARARDVSLFLASQEGAVPRVCVVYGRQTMSFTRSCICFNHAAAWGAIPSTPGREAERREPGKKWSLTHGQARSSTQPHQEWPWTPIPLPAAFTRQSQLHLSSGNVCQGPQSQTSQAESPAGSVEALAFLSSRVLASAGP